MLVILTDFRNTESVPEIEEQFSTIEKAYYLSTEKWIKPVWRLQTETEVLIIISCYIRKTRS